MATEHSEATRSLTSRGQLSGIARPFPGLSLGAARAVVNAQGAVVSGQVRVASGGPQERHNPDGRFRACETSSVDQAPPGWVSLAGGFPEAMASIIAKVLTDNGIAVFKRDDPASSGGYGLGNLRQELLVRVGDLKAAQQLWSEWEKAEPVFPDDLDAQ